MAGFSNLDDPAYAQNAWSRYWLLMRWMGVFAVICMVIGLGIMFAMNGWISIHLYIATGLAIGLAVMLAGALMGLVFLSNSSGHDASVDDSFTKNIDPDE